MPQYLFTGKVHPPALTFTNIEFKIDLELEGDIPKLHMHITIDESQIRLLCSTEQPASMSLLSRIGLGYIRSLVDPVAFNMGVGAIVLLDSITVDDAQTKRFFYTNPRLQRIGLTIRSIPQLQDFALKNREFSASLNELIEALTFSVLVPINCGRAIEGLRKIMVPNDPNRKQGWIAFQNNLNVDRAYREFVTDQSTNPRHGDRTELRPEVIEEILEKSWTMMRRYIDYELGGRQPLSIRNYPLLS